MTHDAFDDILAIRLVPFPESEDGKQCDPWITSIGERTLIVGKQGTKRKARNPDTKSCLVCHLPPSIYLGAFISLFKKKLKNFNIV